MKAPCRLLVSIFLTAIIALPTIIGTSQVMPVQAAWPSDPTKNLPISTRKDIQEYPRIIRDNAGNVFIAWQDNLLESPISNWTKICVQKLTLEGDILWQENGIPATPAIAGSLQNFKIAVDGAGGVFVVWLCNGMDINGDLNYDPSENFGMSRIYAQRLDSSGALTWNAPIRVCDIDYDLHEPQVVPDGWGGQTGGSPSPGGIIIAWCGDYPEPPGMPSLNALAVAAQHIDAGGNRLWGSLGKLVYEAWDGQTIIGNISGARMISDNAHGAVLSWWQATQDDCHLLAQRINETGTYKWAYFAYLGNMGKSAGDHAPVMASDGGNGVVIAWQDYRNNDPNDPNLYAQKVDGNGNVCWQPKGVPVCQAPGIQGHAASIEPSGIDITADGKGGAYVVWEDHRPGMSGDSFVYAQRVDASGTVAWLKDGREVALVPVGHESEPSVSTTEDELALTQAIESRDTVNSIIVSWSDTGRERRYAQKLDFYGHQGWLKDVLLSYTPGSIQDEHAVVPDGLGGAAIVWKDQRNASNQDSDIYAQRVMKDGTLPVSPLLPDLVITDIWQKGSAIFYQIMNQGLGTARGIQRSSLVVNGTAVASDLISQDLRPGERLIRSFNNIWQCPGTSNKIKVCADIDSAIVESNEDNNFREETWKCDALPPGIVSAPSVSGITESLATISWQTDEDSDSVVRYDKRAGKYGSLAQSPGMVKTHSVQLTKLEPATVYHFQVESSDLSGNKVNYRDVIFQTAPPVGVPAPSISLNVPAKLSGKFRVQAPPGAGSDIDRVIFSVDGNPVLTDFTAPFEWECDSNPMADGSHILSAQSFSSAGAISQVNQTVVVQNVFPPAQTPVSVEILDPVSFVVVGGSQPVTVRVTHDLGGRLSSLRIAINGAETNMGFAPPVAAPHDHAFEGTVLMWDTHGLAPGNMYQVRVEATDEHGNRGIATQTVTALASQPLTVSRSVTRQGNYFEVILTIINNSPFDVSNIAVDAANIDFQCLNKMYTAVGLTGPFNTAETGIVSYVAATRSSRLRYVFSGVLAAGEAVRLKYHAVPVMFDTDIGESRAILNSLTVSYILDGTLHRQTPGVRYSSRAEIDQAIASSDYPIVTCPERLFNLYGGGLVPLNNTARLLHADVDRLLCDMAELAKEENGVLGYLSHSAGLDQALILHYGRLVIAPWRLKLPVSWASSGYLLIVGEEDIVSTHAATIRQTTRSDYAVRWTDFPYADTQNDVRPEVRLGRIPGNSAADMAIPIETAIKVRQHQPGYEFDRSYAVALSGWTESRSGGAAYNDFAGVSASLIERLRNQGTAVNLIDTTYFPQRYWGNPPDPRFPIPGTGRDGSLAAFFGATNNADIIQLTGHGNTNVCDDINIWDVLGRTNPFGNAHPVVFASSCLTGQYAAGESLAEAFLKKGAGVYIGSTEISYSGPNLSRTRAFYDRWAQAGWGAVGMPFTSVKEFDGYYEDIWDAEYYLFGDPKYGQGVSPPAGTRGISPARTASSRAASEPQTSLQVVVPGYHVMNSEGEDIIEIPGGQTVFELDRPLVPYYVASFDYPKGYRVQDVALTNRSGLTTATGLNVANFVPRIAVQLAVTAGQPSPGPEWFPEKAFDWKVDERPDGGTTLLVKVYPFYYNSLTTQVEFYQNYSFGVSYVPSAVEITTLTTDKEDYPQGSNVMLGMELNNPGAAQDLVVNVIVKQESSGEVVDGLALRSLKNLTGKASFSAQWDSHGFAPDRYSIEAEVRDATGQVLAREMKRFTLGISAGEITSFSVTPTFFTPGNGISVSLTFNNSGDLASSGTAVFRVQNGAGKIIREFRHDFTDIVPGGSTVFNDVWDTSGVAAGDYRINGEVFYSGTAAAAEGVWITTVANNQPNLPQNISPANKAIGVNLTTVLRSSVFSDPDTGDSQTVSQWQVRTVSGNYTNPVFDTISDNIYLTEIPLTPGILTYATTYYWHVRYQDSRGTWSGWSAETSFTTQAGNYNLAIKITGNGTTSPDAGEHSYPVGTSVNVTATPGTGGVFSHWSGDVSGTSRTISVIMDSDKAITANFIESGYIWISTIKQNPVAYEGKIVKVSGIYRGWEAGHGSPPVTRSDWVIQDATGDIYVSGTSSGLIYPVDIGKTVKVVGVVRLKNGQPYIEIPKQKKIPN